MDFPNLEYLLVTVHLAGPLAGAAFAFPENDSRHLLEIAGQSSTPVNGGLTNTRRMQSLKPGSLALYLNQPPKDIANGFVFGSDPRSCDVLLANTKSSGISANQFSVHIDWLSRDPMITSLSGNDISIKLVGTKTARILSKKMSQTLEPGTSVSVHINGNLEVLVYNPNRGNLKDAYDRALLDYFEEYTHAVPELASISLRDPEVTPLILHRYPGLEGREYYTAGKIDTGDIDYDAKVFLYNSKSKLTADDFTRIQGCTGGYEDVEDWRLRDPKAARPAELYVVKHFRDRKVDLPLPRRFPDLCRLNHLNLEDLVDIISDHSVFMVVTHVFSRTTLHVLLQEEKPLSTIEAGFVLGQIFAALEYLHDHGWTHGNLDPRSIQIMSRKHLWVKLTDSALCWYVDLGKPDDYNAIYASQSFRENDKSPADIWSAGVVGLQLLLRDGLPHSRPKHRTRWVQKLASLAVETERKSRSDATRFIRRVLKYNFDERPKATEALQDPFIVRIRGEIPFNNHHYTFPTPKGSRHTSLAPSDAPSSQGSPRQGSRQTSLGPSNAPSGQSSATPSDTSVQRMQAIMEARISPGLLDYIDLDNFDFDKWEHVDIPAEHGASHSQSSHFAAGSLARGSPAPTEHGPDDNASASANQRSLRPPPRNDGAPGPSRSQSRSGGIISPVSDWATGTFGPIESQRKAEIEEDSGEETETGKPREPATKKQRRRVVEPEHQMNLKSRGKKPR